MPLSGVAGCAEIMDAVHPGGLGGTYGGNPVARAAALGALETIEGVGSRGARAEIERLSAKEPGLRGGVLPAAETSQRPRRDDRARVREAGTTEPNPDAAKQIAARCLSRASRSTRGTYGQHLLSRLLPPLVIGCRDALGVFAAAIQELAPILLT
ncbi:aminotransferase class III-fold pyridoxal phosphate-dependent enzyme [Kocuria rhizophila]|nr:aminotransferase class III-fold pyridoxal phosphate-dependent enzyme [Kocuria rhizophila]